jgi:predicted ATPase
VGGEAGVGKTRLVAELADRRRSAGARVLAGGCLPIGGDGLPYAPIVEALRSLPTDLGMDAVRRLIGPSWSELARRHPVTLIVEDLHWADRSTRDLLASWSATFAASGSC